MYARLNKYHTFEVVENMLKFTKNKLRVETTVNYCHFKSCLDV